MALLIRSGGGQWMHIASQELTSAVAMPGGALHYFETRSISGSILEPAKRDSSLAGKA